MTRLRFLLTAILSVLGALIPWRWKRGDRSRSFESGVRGLNVKIYPMEIVSNDLATWDHFTCTLMTKDGKWQWRTADGREMSPVFDSQEEAAGFHSGMGHSVTIRENA